jgi:hypothetical protein
MLSHWWLVYYFLTTTTDIYYKLENFRNTELEDQGDLPMDQSRTSTLIIQSKKSQKILLWVFVFVAILFICCAIVKSMILDRSSNLGIFLNLTPVIEVFLIIGGLLIALLKLRSFHKNYKLRVNKTKLWQHFSIVLLLLLLFLLDFFKT